MELSFISTRNKNNKIGFWESIVQGTASDGGLLVPEKIPVLEPSLMRDESFWKGAKIPGLSTMLHRLFIPRDEISDEDLEAMMKIAHDFPLPLQKLGENDLVLRIDRGPTASFKDVAARSLAQLMDRYCEKFNKKINIVVATSGDTGVAIADAFGGSKRITITVLYPSDGVSPIQEKQMIEVHHKYPNEQSIPIKGNFDNCQDISKILQSARGIGSLDTSAKESRTNSIIDEAKVKLGMKVDSGYIDEIAEVVEKLNLSSANSINIWRLIPQMTQYFVAYSELVKKGEIKAGEKVIFAVPTGNVGHLMAGIYAREVGLPIKSFIMGTNANNILANVIGSGMIKHKGFCKTSSPSMDILDPSNLERLLAYAADKTRFAGEVDFVKMKKDIKKIDEIINSTKEEIQNLKKITASREEIDRAYQGFRDVWAGSHPISEYGVTDEMIKFLRSIIWAEDVETDEEVYAMMNLINKKHKRVLEPHGTSAYIAYLRARAKNVIDSDDKVVVFETAHPDKFGESLKEAGLSVPKKEKHKVLARLARLNINKMGKPKPLEIEPLEVAKKIREVASKI